VVGRAGEFARFLFYFGNRSGKGILKVRVMRVNSTNVLDEGLRIRGIGRQMNSKVKISQTRRVSRINLVVNLAYSQSVPDRPLLAPIYRWPGLKEPVGSDTYYNIYIRHGLINGPLGYTSNRLY
jgi:hypothetical protein